jgi:hypothetical protein
MTVSRTARSAGPFVGNGATTSFPFTFKVFHRDDLEVTYTDADGVATVLTDNYYTVSLNADQDANPGGTITYPLAGSAMADPESLAIIGDAAYEQATDIANAGRFLPRVVENALDLLTILIQQLYDKFGRALLYPAGESTTATLPTIAQRAGKFFAFDAVGAPTAATGTGNDSALRTDLAASGGSALGGFIAAGVGAILRTIQAKLRETKTTQDYTTLAAAVASCGSTRTRLLVNSACTVSADLTIPSTINVQVDGLGIITVDAGKRLTINGSFSAPKGHQCFDAPLLSTAITASVSGTSLVVTAVSNSVLSSGHVVTGGGLEDGVTIAQGWTGGTGTYTLNGDWGAVASTSLTVTGASVIFGTGAVDCVYPQWFGAVADGATDDTSAIRHSVYSQAWGGKLHLTAGNYKVTDSTVLHGGITVEGDGVVDTSTGSPPPSETAVPSYIWMATDSKPIWVIPVRGDRPKIRNIAHGASAAPSGVAPIGTGRVGILLNGRAPQFVYAPDIENCYFYHLERGISVNDSLAGSTTNWGVNPGTVRNCHFVYCQYGILFYTDNADAWLLSQDVFILPANSSGVHLMRSGFIKLDTCFAFGGSRANSEFIKIAPIETGNPIDTVTIDNCQAEYCSHFLTSDGANTRSFDIIMRNCIPQLGADIYLGNPCTLTSTNTHLMAFAYYDHADVRINSIVDWFEFQNFVSGATWNYVNAGAGAANAIQTYIPGAFPSSTLGPNARTSGWSLNKAPVTVSADPYTVVQSDLTLVADLAATITMALPVASTCPGRKLRFTTRQAQLVISSQSNVIPLAGGAASNAILAATAGKWAELESDGLYWAITAAN